MRRVQAVLKFSIPYRLEREGGSLEVELYPRKSLKGDTPPSIVTLSEDDTPGLWHGEARLPLSHTRFLRYRYRVMGSDGKLLRVEPGLPHVLPYAKLPASPLTLHDRWTDPSPDHILSHKLLRPFLPKSSFPAFVSQKIPSPAPGADVFLLSEPLPYPGELAIAGSHPLLGRWDPEVALFVDPYERGGYYFRFPGDILETEYKFVLRTSAGGWIWEEGPNRSFRKTTDSGAALVTLEAPRFPGLEPRERPQLEGTAVPLFALRTERSYGVGDFSDARDFADWQAAVGQHVLQFLPLYDTRFRDNLRDTYPYNATTTVGLHPLYLDVRRLPYYDDAPRMTRSEWEKAAAAFNRREKVAYNEVLSLKLDIARYSFRRYIAASSGRLYSDLEALFGSLYETILPELRGYAAFYAQKKRHPRTGVHEWPPYDPETLEEDEEYHFSFFLQLQLYKQLGELTAYAASKGVLLKGDLPIGVGRDSADAWMHPELFHLELEAGSPPDAFSETGQNWSFPTYDWEAMKADGYAWWRRRLRVMSRYFGLIRVDHILGFFRIYSIPRHAKSNLSGYYVPALGYRPDEVSDILSFFSRDPDGLLHPHLLPEKEPSYVTLSPAKKERVRYYRDEYYYRRNEELWRETALERLSGVFAGCPMIICAEDLGVLPGSITDLLRRSEILSLEVLRMPKSPGHPFVCPEDIPYLSVLATSTHDTSTVREWWLDELTEREREELAGHYGCKASTGSLIRALRRQDNLFLILPLQDWFTLAHYNSAIPAASERINSPADPDNVWDYRMLGFIKDLPTKL